MKISPYWLREFAPIAADDRQMAEDLSRIGLAVEEISGQGASTVFEMETGTNRPDAMNHYGIAREAAALYAVSLKPLVDAPGPSPGSRPARAPSPAAPFHIEIADPEGCGCLSAS